MNLTIPFRPKLLDALQGYTRERFRQDFAAGLNVTTLAFPLSMAFAIASGVKPEQGLFTAIIGGGIIAALGGSRVQIGGPTGAFVIITYSIVQSAGFGGLFLCTMMAGVMLCLMGLAKMGSIIRFIPYPVSRAFTKGIAVLILSSQIKTFLGLQVDKMPVDFVGKMQMLGSHLGAFHWPTVGLVAGLGGIDRPVAEASGAHRAGSDGGLGRGHGGRRFVRVPTALGHRHHRFGIRRVFRQTARHGHADGGLGDDQELDPARVHHRPAGGDAGAAGRGGDGWIVR